MRLNADHEHVARIALALAGVDVAAQRRVLDELPCRLDRSEARARRNAAIRDAHRLVGNLTQLHDELHAFYSRTWPLQRHLIAPPPDATPLRRAYFYVCQGTEDAGANMPCRKTISRAIYGH